ncbi:MAG: carbohydrate-binding domain-containing protein, partial [Actinomycetota bacterium]
TDTTITATYEVAADNTCATTQPPPGEVTQGSTLRIRALGSTGSERLSVRIGGNEVAVLTLGSTFQLFEVAVPAETDLGDVVLAFVNNGYEAGRDRNTRIDWAELHGERRQAEDPSTVSSGTYSPGSGCSTGAKRSEWLHCSGAFSFAPSAGALDPDPDPTPDPPTPPIDDEPPTDAPPTDVPPTDDEVDPVEPPVGGGAGGGSGSGSGGSETGTVVVRALGSTGAEHLAVRIGGNVIETISLSTSFVNHEVDVPAGTALADIELVFVNDGTTAGRDRNVRIDRVMFDGRRYEVEDASTYSTGTYRAGSGCAPGNKRSEWLHCNGYVRLDAAVDDGTPVTPSPSPPTPPSPAPEPPADDEADDRPDEPVDSTGVRLRLSARGSTGTERLLVRIGGSTVSEVVVGTGFAVYEVGVAAERLIAQVELAFVNNGYEQGVDRDVNVDWLELDGIRHEAEAPTTRSSGTYSPGAGCTVGYKRSPWLHCNGGFLFDLRPGENR